jgi:hypothetical protein
MAVMAEHSNKKNQPWLGILLGLLLLFLLVAGIYYPKYLTAGHQKGTLSIDIFPFEAKEKGAKWRVENGDWQYSNMNIQLRPDDYTVEFKDLEGWTKPANRVVSVKKDKKTVIEGRYILHKTTITVNIRPQKAIDAGAKWRIKGWVNGKGWHEWENSGAQTQLKSQGQYIIVFKNIQGWEKPSKKIVHTRLDADLVINGNYSNLPVRSKETEKGTLEEARRKDEKAYLKKTKKEVPISITVNINPVAANQAGAGWKILGPGNWKRSGDTIDGLIDMAYTIIFKNIPHWRKPNNIIVDVRGSGGIFREGMYTKIVAESKPVLQENSSPPTMIIPDSGLLSVTIRPNKAVQAGAKWKIEGFDWQESGKHINLVPMSYQIRFFHIAGWTKPRSIDVAIEKGANSIEATYRR